MKLFNKLLDSIYEPSINITRFEDPIAEQVSWKPIKRGGSSFRTHKAVVLSQSRLEFKITIALKIFTISFIIVPLINFGIILYDKGESIDSLVLNEGFILPIITIGVFIIAGLIMFILQKKPIIFDKYHGYFWKGKSDYRMLSEKKRNKIVKFNSIHAIQIISEIVRNNTGKSHHIFKSFELNLVLKDASRVNVIDYGNKKGIREDANLLSEFLNVPVWDSTL